MKPSRKADELGNLSENDRNVIFAELNDNGEALIKSLLKDKLLYSLDQSILLEIGNVANSLKRLTSEIEALRPVSK